jgi:hypothetical protein
MVLLKYCRSAVLVAALGLISLIFAPKTLADDISKAVDAFDRDLGLERLGPDIVNVDQQSPNTEKPSSTANGKPNENGRKSASVHHALSADLLSFQASQRVTDTLRGYMIAKVTQNDPNGLPAAEKRFANDAILHRFDRMFSPYGYSSHNLGDTLAGYLIVSWEMINNTDASQSPEGIRRVRDAVRRRMTQKRKVTALSQVDKQRYSEVFKYVTILVVDHLNELKAKHNEAGQRQLLDQVAKPPLKIGLDLRKMHLTNQGFVM